MVLRGRMRQRCAWRGTNCDVGEAYRIVCNATTLSLSALESCPVLVGQIEGLSIQDGGDARNGGRNGITSSFVRGTPNSGTTQRCHSLLLGLRKTERKKNEAALLQVARSNVPVLVPVPERVHLLLSAAPQIHGSARGSRQGNANLVPPTRSTDGQHQKTRQTDK